jgi:hypothetical protein
MRKQQLGISSLVIPEFEVKSIEQKQPTAAVPDGLHQVADSDGDFCSSLYGRCQ